MNRNFFSIVFTVFFLYLSLTSLTISSVAMPWWFWGVCLLYCPILHGVVSNPIWQIFLLIIFFIAPCWYDDRLKEKLLKPWKGVLCFSLSVSVCLFAGYRSHFSHMKQNSYIIWYKSMMLFNISGRKQKRFLTHHHLAQCWHPSMSCQSCRHWPGETFDLHWWKLLHLWREQ